MADGRRHFANLTVSAFNQLQTDPAIGNGFAETDGRIARRNLSRAGILPALRALWREQFFGLSELGGQDARPTFHLRLRFKQPRAARQSFPALNQNPLFQLLQTFRRRNSFDLRPILALMRVARMQQFFIPFCVIAQKQQTFGIRIEPANRPDIFRKIKFRQRAIFRAVAGELRQHAERFVECDEHNNS